MAPAQNVLPVTLSNLEVDMYSYSVSAVRIVFVVAFILVTPVLSVIPVIATSPDVTSIIVPHIIASAICG